MFHILNVNSFTSQSSKMHALIRLYKLLCYMLIYNLEVSFNFHSTFLEVNMIKMFTVQEKLFFFFLYLAIFF